ncbi:hypothetical protein PCK1_002949 [Pneumocystis canis]|nr:hypothetical protein PCK1_002949 [Pneumocystis canis]
MACYHKENRNICTKTRRCMHLWKTSPVMIKRHSSTSILANITNLHSCPLQRTASSMDFQKIMSYLSPLPSTLKQFYHCQSFKLADSTMIPMAYIREKIPDIAPEHWLNLQTCTHYLSVSPHSNDFYPVHDIILSSQCVFMPQTFFHSTSHTLMIKPLPHPPSFFIILYWLYTNNSHQLYFLLLKEIQKDPSLHWIQGFSMNLQSLGLINPNIIHVVKKLLYYFSF